MAMTCPAPISSADCSENRPTVPQPQIATLSPGRISQLSAAIQPVGRMSDRNSTWSSDSPSGTTSGPTLALGTRTNSAWPPAMPP